MEEGSGIGALVFMVVYFGIIIAMIAGVWKMFSKAGEPGWASIIPIYNMIVFVKVSGKPLWWIILLFIPFVNFVAILLMSLSLAEKFGKSGAFGAGLFFLPFIFIPILGFGDADYQG